MIILGLIGIIILIIVCGIDVENEKKKHPDDPTIGAHSTQSYQDYASVRYSFSSHAALREEGYDENNIPFFVLVAYPTVDRRQVLTRVSYFQQYGNLEITSAMSIRNSTASLSNYLQTMSAKFPNTSFYVDSERKLFVIVNVVPLYTSEYTLLNTWYDQTKAFQQIVTNRLDE